MTDMKPKTLKFRFDVQGTLVGSRTTEDDNSMRLLLKRLKNAGHHITVWSGNDLQATKDTIKRIGLSEFVDKYEEKLSPEGVADILFDDDPLMSISPWAKISIIL